jgi:hypothetical protein
MEWKRGHAEYTQAQTGLTADEKIASLFQPDTVLAAQYFENLRRRTVLEPEKKLMLAILEDAVNCFQDNLSAQNGRGQKLFEEAEQWIVEFGSDWIFSFEHICEALGFKPEYVRQGLLQWKERHRSKHLKRGAWEMKKMVG